MSSETHVEEQTPTVEEPVVELVPEPSLPFEALEEAELTPLRSGPRICCTHHNHRQYYGPVTIRNYIAGGTKKALRTSKAAKEAPQHGQVFLKLPIELQLCVLEHCHPYDLYVLSAVSKILRRLVLAPKAAGVWKTAFERHEDLPKPPPGVIESNWAFMIYGPGICGECGRLGALTDFGLLRRYCEQCVKGHVAYINYFRDQAGNSISTAHQIWELLPRTYRNLSLRYQASYPSISNAKFHKEDFRIMYKKWTILELLVEQGVPELPELWEDYKSKLTEFITKRNEAATKANQWAVEVHQGFAGEYDALYSKLTEHAKKRLQNNGHDSNDVQAASYYIQSTFRGEGINKLSPKAFRHITPKLEQHVKSRKDARLKEQREKLLQGIYESYLKSQEPDKWQYLPQSRFINHMAKDSTPLGDFLNAPYTERGDLRPGDVAEQIPGYISTWRKEIQEEILKVFSKDQPHIQSQSFDDQFKRLELATSVLTCTDCKYKAQSGRVLIGWDNICRHRRSTMPGYSDPCGTYEVNDNAIAAAASLVSCVGLDPSTATAKEMDERNDRFMCGNCLPEDHNGVRGLRVYNWVECIQHAMEQSINHGNAMHDTPSWLLLTPEAARFVKEHERPHPLSGSDHHRWRCNLCAEHFHKSVNQREAVEHVKKFHCISQPAIGVDVVANLTRPLRRRKPFLLGTDPSFDCRCLRCPEMSIYKLWTLTGLVDHLKSAHATEGPTEGVDYKLILTVALTPPPPPPVETTETTETTEQPATEPTNTDQPTADHSQQ